MEHEVKEHLTVDSVMTADGEVVPLGPVDKEGRKVSLSTATLFADSGMEWMANELLLLRRLAHRVHPLCPRPRRLQLVRWFHDPDAPI